MPRPDLTKALAVTQQKQTIDLTTQSRWPDAYGSFASMPYRQLPRDPRIFLPPAFAPSLPPPNFPTDEPRDPTQQPLPRIWETPVGWNLPTPPRGLEPVGFGVLRSLARVVDVVRVAIETIKREVASAEWDIVLRDDDLQKQRGKDYLADERRELTDWFEAPDPLRPGENMDDWLRRAIEEVLVPDALAVLPRLTLLPGKGPLGSSLSALQILDGTTIKPLIDYQGGTPLPPAPAYQQYLYGVPRSEYISALDTDPDMNAPIANFDVNSLLYRPFNTRSFSTWGFSPVEQGLINIVTFLKRTEWWQSYFTEGDIPAAFLTAAEGMNIDQMNAFEMALHSMMGGDQGWKWRVKMIPFGSKFEPVKTPNFDVNLDEHLIKLLLAPFHVSPQSLGFTPQRGLGGRGFAEEQTDTEMRKAVNPYLRWFERLFTWIIRRYFHQPDLKFKFREIDTEDEQANATIDKIYTDAGIRTRAEVRNERGWEEVEEPMANVLTVTTAQGVMPLSQFDPETQAAIQDQAHQRAVELAQSRPAPVAAVANDQQGQRPSPEADMTKSVLAELDDFERYALKRLRG